MRKLLLLLPPLLTLSASAQTLTKAQTAEFKAHIIQNYRNAEAAGRANNFEMVCATLQKQNAILATVMTDLQTHFPEIDWMQLRLENTKMLERDTCFASGLMML